MGTHGIILSDLTLFASDTYNRIVKIQEGVYLAKYTTFKIGGKARFFCVVTDEQELLEAVTFAKEKSFKIFILGGGSNILVSDYGFDGLVIKMDFKGIKIISDDKRSVILSVGAGENWDDLVAYTVDNNLSGIENLSAIPGTVGAGPVQNIGAYGSEIRETLVGVRVLDTSSMKFVDMGNADCRFAYRDSVFKHEKGKYIITRVDLKLNRDGQVNIDYKDLASYFSTRDLKNNSKPTLQEVRQAVIEIRASKLPDLNKWGTAGSFFKNPIISTEKLFELKKQYPDLPTFPELDGRVKVSLGWILDKVCNVKGVSIGGARVYEKQALVLVGKTGTTSEEVKKLAQELMKRVKDKVGIDIEPEVEWV